MGFVQEQLRKLVFSAGGIVVTLAWWTFTDGDYEDVYAAVGEGELLTSVGGGGMTMEVQIDANVPVRVHQDFACAPWDTGDWEQYTGWQEFPPGEHSFTVEVGPHCGYGFLQLGPEDRDDIEVGTWLWWTIRVDGEFWERQEETLEEPLREGYGMALIREWEAESFEQAHAWITGNY